jgi:high-affinity iron transporter
MARSWWDARSTDVPAGHRLSETTVVLDSAILVFREGLETILVLAAVTASFLGANRAYRRPVVVGSATAMLASVATWFVVIWFIGQFHGGELDVQAATGIPALIVLLIVMNWFFADVAPDARADLAPDATVRPATAWVAPTPS